LSEETVRKVLKDFGLTDKETDVYIFLAKHGVLKGGEISKQAKTHKALVYRILKSLQAKGLVESTLEFPARFTAIPFETVIDLNIKAKQEEAAQIKERKMELLNYWRKIQKPEPELPLEKFTVIEGNTKIYHKLSQMVRETKNQLLTVTTLQGLVHEDQLGFFETGCNHPFKSTITFRFLAELSPQNVRAMKEILSTLIKAEVNFEGRTPELGINLGPQMTIRDQEEAMFFITPKVNAPSARLSNMCLWTNCKSLVYAFSAVFEDLWHNSTDIQEKITEIETGQATPKTFTIKDANTAKKKYNEIAKSAKEEILVLTSSQGLIQLSKTMPQRTTMTEKGVTVKIMAPITSNNLEAANRLSKLYSIKHIPPNYLPTTIIDGKHLFQFKTPTQENKPVDLSKQFSNSLYSNDPEYVKKAKNMLNEHWKNARQPSTENLKSIFGTGIQSQCAAYFPGAIRSPGPQGTFYPLPPDLAKKSDYTVVEIVDEDPSGKLTERDVLNEIINSHKLPPEKQKWKVYSSQASAIIHLPEFFNLPPMLIRAHQIEKYSYWGEEQVLLINLWLETSNGPAYVPVAVLSNNVKAHVYWKRHLAASPAGQNVQLAKENDLQIHVHGNTLFAGWTVPIPLFPSQHVLPPAFMLIEGYGDVKSAAYTIIGPAGGFTAKQNGFDAFVTFMHSSSKYSGPGTDGFFVRDFILDILPGTSKEHRPTLKHHLIEKKRE
jgi:sugar-specific transcriptional regulator TrmB